MALTATSSSGSQTATQNPQQAPAASSDFSSGAQQGSAVQPGTPESALNSQNGLILKNTPLNTINLASTSAGTVSVGSDSPKHHSSPLLVGASVILFVIAVVLFWSATRPVKNTSDS